MIVQTALAFFTVACGAGRLISSNLEMRELFELMEPGANLFRLEAAQAVATELLDVVGGHDRSVDDGASQRGFVDLVGLRQVSHEAAGEAVTGAGRVENVFERIGRD